MRRVFTLALATTAVLAATPASASLVFDPNPPVAISAQGFGNVPRSLTIHPTGQGGPAGDLNPPAESGCISVVSAGNHFAGGSGSCLSGAAITMVHDSNGVNNLGGDEENPVADNQKHGIPTVASLGILSAADIGILFNATDPGGDGVNLMDLTLKFYRSDGTLLGAIDGSRVFTGTETGNGSAGFVFDVEAGEEQDYVNSILGLGGTIYMALEATVSDAEGGPESFTIFNLHSPPSVPEPATWAMMLLGFGGIGLGMRRRRSKDGRLLQIA
jgi:PEP-CTERM motif